MTLFVGPISFAEPAVAAPGVVRAAPSECGPAAFRKPNGSLYTCSFVDNFSWKSLDRRKWVVETSGGLSGFSPENTCYVNSPRNVFVRDGKLVLVGRVGSSERCTRTYRGTFRTKYTGGAVVSWERFSQAYGLFSFRAAFPATKKPGYWGNLWLSPQRQIYGRWPRSGEIDVAEYWTGDVDVVHPSLHYQGHSRADTAWDCKVRDVGKFHTYTLQWTPTVMKFYYDSTLCFTRSWKPWNGRDGRPFNHPFVLVMSQGLGDPYFQVSKELPNYGAMQVDWVKVWR